MYGRVLPSTARLHCECSLKKRALAVWREQWWVARKEWKLNIRAECHNRYASLTEHLIAKFSSICGSNFPTFDFQNYCALPTFCSYRLWQKVWSVWTEFVQVSQCKRRKKELARNMVTRRLLCRAWKGWSQYVLARREKKQMKVQIKQWSIMRLKRYILYIN